MPRDGSGGFSLVAGNPVVTGTTISSTVQNNTNNDIAAAIATSLASDGQTTPSANLKMGGFKHTNVANATSRISPNANYASAADVQDGSITYLTTVAGTNTVTASAPLGLAAYVAGQVFSLIPANTNTAATTLNVNAIGAKNLFIQGAAAIGGEFKIGVPVTVSYDGTQFNVLSLTTTATTQAVGDSSTKLATTAFVGAAFPYYIAGLQIVNNGTTSMDIQAGVATDGNNTHVMVNASTFTKNQTTWVAGTGNGGKMSAAAMAANTWYYFWQLRKDADGTVDFGFDVSPTAPTAQAGYTSANYRYIGARKTQAASTSWDTFIQHGDEVWWSTPPALDVNGTALTTGSRTLVTVNVPAIKCKWFGNQASNTPLSTITGILFTDPACADVAVGSSATPLNDYSFNNIGGSNTREGGAASCWANASSQIGVRGITTDIYWLVTRGFMDPRGKPV